MAHILKLILLRFWPLIFGLQLPLFLLLHFPSSTQSQQQFQPSHRQQKWINAQIHPSELIIAQQPQRRSALEPSSNRQLLQPRQISALAHGLPPQHRAKIRGYKTNQRSERQTTIVIDCSAPHNGQCDAGTNFNPTLAGGIRGAPGIKARLNPRAFQYLSTIFGGILNYMIKRARLPTISQCLPAPISGCINVYNLYVSRYRCPQRVTVYPNPPNQIVVDVQNLDVGVTGNLGGQINILIPIALFGIVQVNAHQVSVRVAVTIVNGPDGGPRIQMVSCAASVGYVDVYIQNGGLIGDIANSQLRGKISEMVRQQIPGQLCQRLPGILDSEINSKISGIIPRFIPVSKLLEIAVNAFGLGNLLGGTGQCPASCNFKKAAALGTAQKGNSTVLVLPPHLQLEQKMKLSNFNGSENKNGEILTRPPPEKLLLKEQSDPNLAKSLPTHLAKNAGLNSGNNGGGGKTLNHARLLAGQKSGQGLPVIINSGTTGAHQNRTTHLNRRQLIAPLAPHAARPARATGSKIFALTRPRNDRATPSESGRVSFVDPGENLCQNCPNTGGQDNPLSFLAVILQSMDLSKLNNVYLNVQVMNTYATDHDFTIELNGEFSVCGRGCTPFGAFPMQFPNCVGCKMIEVLISDFTINSLLYHLHNIGFLRVRIGPETPKIGDLLKTTCGESEGDEGLEDHGVETEEGTLAHKKRRRRQDAAGDLASLGICLGDILPAVREKYPNERVYIIISTERAPSVLLSQRNGGTAFVDIVVNADFYIQSTNQKVGTIRIAANIDVTVRPQPNRITAHAEITSLNLQDVGNQLGLPQDALDNLGNLGKEIILKAGNDALERGSSLNIPNGIAGLPISIIDPEIHFLEHALLIQADFTLNPAALGGSEPC